MSNESAFDDLPDVLTMAAVAKFLGLSKTSVRNAVARGELPAVRLNRRVLILKEHLRQALDELADGGRIYGRGVQHDLHSSGGAAGNVSSSVPVTVTMTAGSGTAAGGSDLPGRRSGRRGTEE